MKSPRDIFGLLLSLLYSLRKRIPAIHSPQPQQIQSFTPLSRFNRGRDLSEKFSRNSFRRTLLQRLLHNFSAIAPVNLLDGITYRPNSRKTCKSFRRLLLPLFVPVSPLGAHSYKKMGGGGSCTAGDGNGTHRAPRNSNDPIHIETKCQLRPSAPLSNLFVLNHLQEELQLRPSAPLRKSFRINKPFKIRAPRKLNEFNHLQNRAPAKSFRIISFQKKYVEEGNSMTM